MKSERICYFLRFLIILSFVNQALANKLLDNFKVSLTQLGKQRDQLVNSILNGEPSEKIQASFQEYRKAVQDALENTATIVSSKDGTQIYDAFQIARDSFGTQFKERRYEVFDKIKSSDSPLAKALVSSFHELEKKLDQTQSEVFKYYNLPEVRQHIGNIEKLTGTIHKSIEKLYEQASSIVNKQLEEFKKH